jgi:hypothetical protein
MLLFDLAFSNPGSLRRAQEASKQFVEKNVLPGSSSPAPSAIPANTR